MRSLLVATTAILCWMPASAAPTYPRLVKSIPTRFLGGWDELISDGCKDREPRYLLEPRSASDFEVHWDVKQVTMTSPNSVDILLEIDPDYGKQQTTWRFELVENDKGLKEPGSDLIYKRCPAGWNK